MSITLDADSTTRTIKSFEEAISKAEIAGKLTQESAELSLKAFDSVINGEEPKQEEPVETDQAEVQPEAEEEEEPVEEEKPKTDEKTKEKVTGTHNPDEVKADDTKQKIESRLEFLARMYDQRKNSMPAEESGEDKET